MGLLLDTRSGGLITLSAHMLVGRSSACLVRIGDPRASAEHAAIAWSGEQWEVRDLGSVNGTWLDGRRLARGERAGIRRDSRLAFGGGPPWILADDRPVGPQARNAATSEIVHSTSGILGLPSADDPRATIFRRVDGQWLVELGIESRPVADRDSLDLGGIRWVLFLPSDLGPLPRAFKAEGSALVLGDVSLHFAPGLDDEHVEVRVRTDDGTESVLPPRSIHHMLLALARARITDASDGIAPEEQGWLHASDLADMLQYTAERLDLEIFRARSLLTGLGFADSPQLIERRVSSQQIRIGIPRLHVTRG